MVISKKAMKGEKVNFSPFISWGLATTQGVTKSGFRMSVEAVQ
jgi:hypothetical protein